MNWDLKYGELASDTDFVNRCEELKANLKEVQEVLDKLLPLKKVYHKMELHDQIELDLFLAYALNGLHWIRLRVQGIDPSTHPVKDELDRIKTAMLRWQEMKDEDKRPTLNIKAAERFVKSGLYDRHKAMFKRESFEPQNKKIKFTDNDE